MAMKSFLMGLFIILMSTFSWAGYIAYYNMVNEGEYHMYEGNYELAIANFESAFELVDQPFARDYYLASKCFSQINDEEKMYFYLEQALSNGLKSNFILSDSLWFTSFRFDDRFKTSLNKHYEVKENVILDTNYNNILSDLYFETDSLYRHWMISVFKKDTGESANETRRKAKQDFDTYIEKNYDYFKTQILSRELPQNRNGLVTYRALCGYFLDETSCEYENLVDSLKIKLDQGLIKPISFASFAERMEPFGLSKYGLYSNSIDPARLDEILENRKAIGLSIYYSYSPNYYKNYSPEPISNNFIKPKIKSRSSN